jgi:hypothetical protein
LALTGFSFCASDRDEPLHVHAERDAAMAKYWLEPIRLQHSVGFGRAELARIASLVSENRGIIVEAWNDYFAD